MGARTRTRLFANLDGVRIHRLCFPAGGGPRRALYLGHETRSSKKGRTIRGAAAASDVRPSPRPEAAAPSPDPPPRRSFGVGVGPAVARRVHRRARATARRARDDGIDRDRRGDERVCDAGAHPSEGPPAARVLDSGRRRPVHNAGRRGGTSAPCRRPYLRAAAPSRARVDRLSATPAAHPPQSRPAEGVL